MPHLWEPEHDFYGPEAARDYTGRHDSFEDYLENGFATPRNGYKPGGLNLLYRWDWHEGDDGMVLELFWMMPRKGIMARSVIQVHPEDEPAVRAFLQPHAEYMRSLWAPLLDN